MTRYIMEFPDGADPDDRNWTVRALRNIAQEPGRGWVKVLADMLESAQPADAEPAPELAVAGEVRPGLGYLLSVDRNISAEQADHINRLLKERFPGSTFAILTPDIKPADVGAFVTLTGLLAALQAAEDEVTAEHERATEQWARTATYGGARALRHLRRALLPERAGSGAPPADSPAAESATVTPDPAPFPSRPPTNLEVCAMPHPWMDSVWCTLKQHPVGTAHEAPGADAYHTKIGWSQ